MGCRELYEVQQREVPSPVSGEEKPRASVQTKGWPARTQLARKDLGGPGGHPVKPAVTESYEKGY